MSLLLGPGIYLTLKHNIYSLVVINKSMRKLSFTFAICFFTILSIAQTRIEVVEQDKLFELKVDENRFDYGWLPSTSGNIPCFRDYTKTEISTELVDIKKDSVIHASTETEQIGLKIVPTKISLDKDKRIFFLSGQITGAWENVIPDEFEIFVGRRVDTVSNLTVSPNLHGDIYYNGVKVDKTIVIAKVPAFYLKDFKKFEVYRSGKEDVNSDEEKMLFDINTVIDEESILIFGLSSRYAEIFNIGKLLIGKQIDEKIY